MDDILITDALIITCDGNHSIIENGVMAVNNGKITALERSNTSAAKKLTAKNIIGAIGPSITQKNYEVKADFKKKFIKKHKKNKIFFKNKKELIYFDLPNYVKSQLKSQKINKIDMIKIDTFDRKNNFFSARRSLKLNLNDYGRNISIIMIN